MALTFSTNPLIAGSEVTVLKFPTTTPKPNIPRRYWVVFIEPIMVEFKAMVVEPKVTVSRP